MSKIRIERVISLPGTLLPSTMYIVKSSDTGLAELYFSNQDGSEARHVLNKQDIHAMITESLSSFSNILLTPTIATRDAMVLDRNLLVLVLNATGDPSVESGAALYIYDFENTRWFKVSEFESIDVTFDWSRMSGRPQSTVQDIDDAVSKAHQHVNFNELSLIGENENGQLVYRGSPIPLTLAEDEW